MASGNGAAVEAESHIGIPWYRRFSRWKQTSHAEAVEAERSLLGLLKTPMSTQDVKVGPGPQDYLHTISPETQTDGGAPTLVSIPGYAAGSGHTFRIMDGLAGSFRFYAVDLLGTGLSGRPRFTAATTEQAIDWFVESLEAWRREMRVERMLLMGHSMGGYLSTCYAARYPERVQHLLLVSPVGVGARPPEWEPAQRFTQSWTPRALLFRTAIKCWDHNLTPGRVIRGLGPWGPGLVARYARGRFQQGLALTEEETARFERYFYHILAARGSGEFALRHILEPFAWPRSALEHRAADLPVPVTFFYGDQDWMDVRAGKRMAAALHARRGRACPSDCKVLVTPKAGHYLFMDNPGDFLSQVAFATESYLPAAAKQALLHAAADAPKAAAEPFELPPELEEQLERTRPSSESLVHPDTAAAAAAPTTVQ